MFIWPFYSALGVTVCALLLLRFAPIARRVEWVRQTLLLVTVLCFPAAFVAEAKAATQATLNHAIPVITAQVQAFFQQLTPTTISPTNTTTTPR